MKRIDGELHLYIQMHKRIHKCPKCGANTSKVHDYRSQVIKDISSLGYHTFIHIKKRRHKCKDCGKQFLEEINFLPKYHRMTNRLYAHIVSGCRNLHPLTDIANECNISSQTVSRIFDYVKYPIPKLPRVLSIDEFRGNAGGEKFQCILTNPERKEVLDVLPKRNLDELCRYFTGFKDRSKVELIVMDMSPLFKSMAKTCFPKAKIIADKYHVSRIVSWALEDVRKKEQLKFSDYRRKYFKRSRRLLLKPYYKLTNDEKNQLELMLNISERLRQAYIIKMKFDEFLKSPDSDTARKTLSAWIVFTQNYDLPEFAHCCKTFINWSKEILAMFDYPFTNGYTEGINNKIKVLKRVSFGVRNFERFRNRILHVTA